MIKITGPEHLMKRKGDFAIDGMLVNEFTLLHL